MPLESLIYKHVAGKSLGPQPEGSVQGHCSLPRAAAHTRGFNWPPYPGCRVSAQSELGISEWFAPQSGHAPSDKLFAEIPLGLPHSTHICNAFPCLGLQGCFVVRTYFILVSHLVFGGVRWRK